MRTKRRGEKGGVKGKKEGTGQCSPYTACTRLQPKEAEQGEQIQEGT